MEENFYIINCGRYFTVVNTKGKYENHSHVKTRNTAELLVRLLKNKRVPRSPYLRESALRLTRDKSYIEDIQVKIEKDKNRQKYRNIGGGRNI